MFTTHKRFLSILATLVILGLWRPVPAHAGYIGNDGRWFGGVIPYVISDLVPASGRTNILRAIAHWESRTAIRFLPRTTQRDYVEFRPDASANRCSSRVGRMGNGKQPLYLDSHGKCSRGELIHEIGHLVGLLHEHQRPDRDEYVTIKWGNIQADFKHEFEVKVESATSIGPYNFGSIMHYDEKAWCKIIDFGLAKICRGPTIVPKPSGVSIGQKDGLNAGDVDTVTHIVYPRHPRLLGDVNGDRRKDLVLFGEDGVYVALSTGAGFAGPTRWSSDYGDTEGWREERHPRFLADVNGDGRDDIVGFGHAGVYLSLSSGWRFADATLVFPGYGYDQGWRVSHHPRLLADVNGDRRADIVAFGEEGVYLALSTGKGFMPTAFLPEYGVNAGWQVDRHPRLLADVNGDGRADIVGFGDASVALSLSSGTGFAPATLAFPGFGYSDSAGGWRVEQHLRVLADVNGDKRADIVAFGNDGVSLSLSTGTGFAPSAFRPEYGVNTGWRVDRHPRLLADVNGDGRADIVGFGEAGLALSFSLGLTFDAPVLASTVWRANAGWQVDEHPRVLADVTGDGRPDIVGFGDAGVAVSPWAGINFFDPNFWIAGYGFRDGWR